MQHCIWVEKLWAIKASNARATSISAYKIIRLININGEVLATTLDKYAAALAKNYFKIKIYGRHQDAGAFSPNATNKQKF